MAASVPRFLRQNRLAYLPLTCVIGSRLTQGDKGASLAFDIIMLPAPQFERMKSNVGLQHVIAPTPSPLPGVNHGFVLADTKYVVVPEGEPDPETFAKNHFLKVFGLVAIGAAVEKTKQEILSFSDSAKKITKLPEKYDSDY